MTNKEINLMKCHVMWLVLLLKCHAVLLIFFCYCCQQTISEGGQRTTYCASVLLVFVVKLIHMEIEVLAPSVFICVTQKSSQYGLSHQEEECC